MGDCVSIDLLLDSALKMNRERRKSTRVALTARVKLVLEGEIIEGELVNISLHGALVVAAKPVARHAEVTVTIADTEAGQGIVDLKAKVVRVGSDGIGLEFQKGG